ncbi:phospholipid/cholesterol/gamma-HCH transport system substrate-binding protein [Kibdelosporangium banguiense]|uniref:Phospholipid/cholesterol/gamma-HCH transport system substrate-binding protein n=1 Tax=Kibdelosporangium banguiense TaxID=1365924 RepID=A0ABS4TK36_9PSEU|nr:MlaD family protein [Kibdelosporangium banguiense]MBP2324263.1 phospholipid/cholesterol/gamma-HCH transport system substrate-binding protein [Kibdelosporangium banguiense]
MRSVTGPIIKMAIFAIITVTLTALLGATIANSNFGGTSAYRARFADASGLKVGDDVRILGVKVGTVDSLAVVEDRFAEVRFDMDAGRRLPASATATVKYRNLVGQRYLALGTGIGSADLLKPGDTIPVERTRPALNLTVLFNGFKPLFQALKPEDVNKLAFEIVQVLQGEGGTVDSILQHTATLTSTIAGRDKVIGDLINNLNTVLGTVNGRGNEVSDLILSLQQLVSGLASDREPIGEAVSALGDLTSTTAGLLEQARPSLKQDIALLGPLAETLNKQEPLLDGMLKGLENRADTFTRTVSYGSWLNFYLCRMSGTVGVSALNLQLSLLPVPSTQMPERCGP